MSEYLLGIDVGTTGTKTMLFSKEGEVLGHSYYGYDISNPKLGYSEQNAEDWWKAVVTTVREALAACPDPEHVRAISLSLQGGTIVPVDPWGKPLRPAIVWNDSRCTEEMEEFLQEVGPSSYMYEKTGWKLEPSLPALQIRWLRNHEPEIFAKTAMFLSVPDYIAFCMTGKPAADISNAGINELYDIREEKYDEKILAFAGITKEQLPKIVHTGEVIGTLTGEAAGELGLSTDTVLVAGAHDQYAVAVGGGAINNGDIMIGSGTAWVVTAISDQPEFSTGFSQSVSAVPGKWGSILSLSTGGVCLDWIRKNIALGQDPEAVLSYEEINEKLTGKCAAAQNLFFYPFSGIFGGKAEFGKASFLGMDLSHDRFDLICAVMEGVAFQINWKLEAFPGYTGNRSICLAGGASKSRIWSQMLADITGHPIEIPAIADLACVGAAVIAGTGCGIYSSIREGYESLSVQRTTLLPDPEKTESYRKYFQKYKKDAEILSLVYQ